MLMSVSAFHGSLAFSAVNNVALNSKRSLSSNVNVGVHQEHYGRRDLRMFGFFDELFGGGGGDQRKDEDVKDEKNTVESKSAPVPVVSNSLDQGGGVAVADVGFNADADADSMEFSEVDFRQELEKRNNVNTENQEEEEEFDGYALRDAIYNKWGQCFDLEFQPVTTYGFRNLYLNVMPFRLGGRRFRHKTELDYLCHLQAVVEILVKYDQLDYVLMQLDETTKKPRPGTSPLVAVPFRLDLTEEELNSILND